MSHNDLIKMQEYQEDSPGNGHQGDMPYYNKASTTCSTFRLTFDPITFFYKLPKSMS